MAGVTQRAHFLSGPFFMTISKCMLFKLTTVVDITQTNARRGEDKKKENQQANFNTMFQTIGLRVNVEPLGCTQSVIDVDKLEYKFGSAIKGKQRVWTFEFENTYEGALTLDMMINDFDLVPVIVNLEETAANTNNIFSTKHVESSSESKFSKYLNHLGKSLFTSTFLSSIFFTSSFSLIVGLTIFVISVAASII